jgi:hypothetical protein
MTSDFSRPSRLTQWIARAVTPYWSRKNAWGVQPADRRVRRAGGRAGGRDARPDQVGWSGFG